MATLRWIAGAPPSDAGETVVSVSRDGGADDEVFAVESRSSGTRVRYARSVVFAIGYYDRPVMLGIPGEHLPHVSHYYGEAHAHYRQRVVIVGGGNSAAEAALEMYRAGAHVTLVHRAPTLKDTIKYWVRPDIENRIKEGSIAARLGTCITAIRPTSVLVKSFEGGDAAEEIRFQTPIRHEPFNGSTGGLDLIRGPCRRALPGALFPAGCDPQEIEVGLQ